MKQRSAAASVVSVAMLAVLVTVSAAAWLTGWELNVVDSTSMEPVVRKDALAVIAPVDAQEVGRGDVIAYSDGAGANILHRVVEVLERPEGLFFSTKGDANATSDPVIVPANRIRGELRFQLRGLGTAVRALQGGLGLLLLVGVPATLLLWTEIRSRRRRSANESTSEDAESEQERSGASPS